MWQPELMQSCPGWRPWWFVDPGVLIVTPNHWYGYSWQLSHVAEPTAVCAAVLPFMFMPANDVKFVGEWHRSHAMPTAGTCVCGEGVVGDPPEASGGVFGWYVSGGGDEHAACVEQPANGPAPAPAEWQAMHPLLTPVCSVVMLLVRPATEKSPGTT